jgi:hypothetical protein
LAIGYWLLAIGYWLLAIGYRLLAVGCWLLAVGCWLLAVGYWLFTEQWSRGAPLSRARAEPAFGLLRSRTRAQRTGGNPLFCVPPCRRAKWGSKRLPTTPRAYLCSVEGPSRYYQLAAFCAREGGRAPRAPASIWVLYRQSPGPGVLPGIKPQLELELERRSRWPAAREPASCISISARC